MARHVVRALRPRGRAWVWALFAAGLLLNAGKWRRRLAALPVIHRRVPAVPAESAVQAPASIGCYAVVAVEGAAVDEVALDAAAAHAESQALELLDLVPADLDAERLLDVIRHIDPATYRNDRLAKTWGANQVLLVSHELLKRMDWQLPEDRIEEADLADLVTEAKRFAPVGCDLAIVEGVQTAPEDGTRRRSLLRAQHGDDNAAAGSLLGLAVLGAGLIVAPGWGLLALAAYCAQQPLALRGGGTWSGGPSPGAAALRPFSSAARAVRTGRAPAPTGPSREDQQIELAQARTEYRELIAGGIDRFFEPRRDSCAWCGGGDLATKVKCSDQAQRKPGRFRLDRCRSCGHVFQNPRLSPEGLDFYYRDFYSGSFGNVMTPKFEIDGLLYRLRADIVRRHYDGEPNLWLDVGTGHGHFCLAARDQFPRTRFEALDMGESVVTAELRGWVDQAHLGQLTDYADGLAGRFDVVSMHHYLEHTPEPKGQLAEIAQVVRPGGYLSIEVPDPECLSGTVLGRWWGPWFQPQHLNMIPIDNLSAELRALGFSIVATERKEAHEQFECTYAAYLLLHCLASPPGLPWREERRSDAARRVVVFVIGSPLIALGLIVDRVLDPIVRRLPRGPNAYRVLARRDDPVGHHAG